MLKTPTVIDRLWPLLMLSKLFGLSSFPINKRNDGTISYKVQLMTCIWSIIIHILLRATEPLTKNDFNYAFQLLLITLIYCLCFSTEPKLIFAINQLLKYDIRTNQFKYFQKTKNYGSKWIIILIAIRLSFGVFPSSYEILRSIFDWNQLLKIAYRELYVCPFYSVHYTSLFLLKDLKDRFQNLSYEWYSLILNPSKCTPSELENIRILYSELKEITKIINSVCDKRSMNLVVFTALQIFLSAYDLSANYKDLSTYQYADELSHSTYIILLALVIRISNDLIGMSMDIVDSLMITSIARLSIECQEQVRFMYECVRTGPLTITICGCPVSSRVWPVVLMEEINIWIAVVQLEQELKRISTRTRIQIFDWVIWNNSQINSTYPTIHISG